MNIEKRAGTEKKETEETDTTLPHLSKSAKTTLAVGTALSLVLASLAVVVHSLGNVDIKIRINRKK